ncbi:MAG TPA: sugar transferase, partial [Anaerolineales bacterium]|nr:sugar transferase [Anaerolineales bacterium]
YFWAAGDAWLEFSLEFIRLRPPIWFFLLPLVWLLLIIDLYDARKVNNYRATVRGILIAAGIGLVIYSAVYFTSPPKSLPRRGVAAFLVSASALTLAWRLIWIRLSTQSQASRRAMLVGAGETGIALLKVINAQVPPPYQVLGIIDDDPFKQGNYIEKYPVVGGSECLVAIGEKEGLVELLVAISGEMQSGMFQALLDAQERGILITRMPVAYEEILGRIPIHHLEANWILRTFVDHARSSRFYELTKRLIDVLGGLAGVGLTIMFFPLVALATLLDSGRPILYVQTRAGSGGQPYHMIKFRTMFQDAEADGQPQWASENDERATRVGRILRKTHLDELPQFINVLRGEMSLVGPRAERPELVDYFQEYVPFYRARLLIKPGITGWAQINFGYAVTIEDTATKLEYDLYYIKNRNILLDLLIVLRTVASVAGFRGR